MRYIKQKRNQIDYCNICEKKRNLTWDHVPPKSITDCNDIITNTIFKDLPTPQNHMKRYQNGIKYRSLCQECNNVLLGENDSVYKQFITDVKTQIESPVLLPHITVSVKINRLCRAMIGHILAAKNSYEPNVIPDKIMRQYVLNNELSLSGINLYVWLYPYESTVIARDFVITSYKHNTHPSGMVSGVIMHYPMAYMIVDKEKNCGVDDIGKYTTNKIEDIVSVSLNFNSLFIYGSTIYKPFNWPLNVCDDHNIGAALVFGSQSFGDDSRLGVSL